MPCSRSRFAVVMPEQPAPMMQTLVMREPSRHSKAVRTYSSVRGDDVKWSTIRFIA